MTLLRHALRLLRKRAEVDTDRGGFPPEVRERIRKALAERRDQEHDHAR